MKLVREALRAIDEASCADGHQAGRKRVEEAVGAIDKASFSVFSCAILSGQMDAVQLIYELVVKLCPSTSREVREMKGASMPCSGVSWWRV